MVSSLAAKAETIFVFVCGKITIESSLAYAQAFRRTKSVAAAQIKNQPNVDITYLVELGNVSQRCVLCSHTVRPRDLRARTRSATVASACLQIGHRCRERVTVGCLVISSLSHTLFRLCSDFRKWDSAGGCSTDSLS